MRANPVRANPACSRNADMGPVLIVKIHQGTAMLQVGRHNSHKKMGNYAISTTSSKAPLARCAIQHGNPSSTQTCRVARPTKALAFFGWPRLQLGLPPLLRAPLGHLNQRRQLLPELLKVGGAHAKGRVDHAVVDFARLKDPRTASWKTTLC